MILTLEKAQEMMRENNGNLNLSNTSITNLPEGLTVSGWLDLSNTLIESLPEGLTVYGSLYLNNTRIRSLSENLIVGDALDLSNTRIIRLPNNLTVGGGINLINTPIKSLPEDLTVGRGLDLSYTSVGSLSEGLTIGGNLYLYNSSIESLSKRLIIGGNVFGKALKRSQYKQLQNGDYLPGKYLYADNILTHVKSCKQAGEYTFYVGKIKGKNVLSDGTNYVHCVTLSEGMTDLLYKTSVTRGAGQYKHLTKESRVALNEAITMYRVITGACKQGTENFVSSQKEFRQEYLISEIIELTRGQFGSEKFASFFER